VRGLIIDGARADVAEQGQEVEIVLDATPFYAEAGGQAADTGLITGDGFVVEVTDVQAPMRGLSVHRAVVREGELPASATVLAQVDQARRHAGEEAHTATHLVHAALHQVLGPEALQSGSFNKAGYLRFDFTWADALSAAASSEVEDVVNQAIDHDFEVITRVMKKDEAKALGATSLFGEKYGDMVRVVEIDGAWSREFCGGTHVAHTSKVGSMSLLGEASVGSGNRRVEALVGLSAFRHNAAERALVNDLTELFRVPAGELRERINSTVDRLRTAEKEIEKLRREKLQAASASLVAEAHDVSGVRLIAHDAGTVDSADDLRSLALPARDRLGQDAAVVAVTGVVKGKPVLLVATNEAARAAGVKAGALVRAGAKVLGGGGGGKDDVAQGGGQNPAAVADALAEVTRLVSQA
jgi:alanyl-tRNA synthetase